jgi:hypothetical protein
MLPLAEAQAAVLAEARRQVADARRQVADSDG